MSFIAHSLSVSFLFMYTSPCWSILQYLTFYVVFMCVVLNFKFHVLFCRLLVYNPSVFTVCEIRIIFFQICCNMHIFNIMLDQHISSCYCSCKKKEKKKRKDNKIVFLTYLVKVELKKSFNVLMTHYYHQMPPEAHIYKCTGEVQRKVCLK